MGISYENIEDEKENFPLLKPMSEIAGRGGFLAACQFSRSEYGNGLLLERLPGVRTPKIAIIGAGSAGMGAAELAAAFGNQ